ncbi:MAG: TolC family protein [Magnetococcales bacterium]|nr:TolC family protein [Magnetococcales bacterium]
MDKQTNTARLSCPNRRFPVLRRGGVLLSVAGVSGLLLSCSYGASPFTPGERAEILTNDRAALFTQQAPVTRPISLFEAMARAMKYNLSHRVALMEKAVAQRQLDLSQFDLLPQLSATTDLKARNNPDAANGYAVTDQVLTKTYSTSQDQTRATAKLTMAWNILDFGVSAIQASQDADRALIANENQRKAVHVLLQDVRSTFWRAAGAQKLEDAIGPVIQQARNALSDARQVEQERLKPQLEILRYQKTLLEIVRQLEELRHQLSLAKTEFAALINLPPGSAFQLDVPDDPSLTIPEVRMTVEEMESLALDNRPDMREAMYTARISRGDVRKAMLRLLPGLEFQAGYNWDSNSFALNSQWEEASSRVVLNIMNILQGPTAIHLAENKEELARMRRLTLQMAVFTQVHLAFRQYVSDRRKLASVEEIDAVDQRIFKNYGVTARNDAQSRLEYISAAASAIMSRLQLYQAYADAQNSVGRIFVTLGVDLAPKANRLDDIPVLTDALREAVTEWDAGVSSTPLQQVQEHLSRSPKASIPDYFLDPHFLGELTDAPVAGESGASGRNAGLENDLQPVAPAPARLFGGEKKTPDVEAGQTPRGAESPQEMAPPPAKEENLGVVKLPPAPAGPPSVVPPPSAQKENVAGGKPSPVQPGETAGGKPSSVQPGETAGGKPSPVQPGESAGSKPPPAPKENAVGAKSPPVLGEAAAGVKPPDLKGKGGEGGDPRLLAEVQEMLQAWAKAWSERNSEAYWGFYAGDQIMPTQGQSLETWRQRTKASWQYLTFLQVDVSDLEVVREVPEPLARLLKKGPIEFVQVAFRESYRSDHLQTFSRKLMILGKRADGWKIFREAVSPPVQPRLGTLSGFAIQVALLDATANPKPVLDEWSAKGFHPTVVSVLDEKRQLHSSVRLAYCQERSRAQFFRWLLLLATGVDSVIVPADVKELAETAPTHPDQGEAHPPAPEGSAAAHKEQTTVPKQKSPNNETDDAEGER